MKTPPNPSKRDLVVARGIGTRRKRDETLRPARAETHTPKHSLSGCSGTETLASIERALLRLSSGTYGICLSCGADISLARLERNPAIETCETCDDKVWFKAH
ncbi:MAG: TraR/DksA C4-type zinc finger protein [Pseudomonadota bacterium]